MRDHADKPYLRERAPAILQVTEGCSGHCVVINGLLRQRKPDTIYGWLDRYEVGGIDGLPIDEGRGRKAAYDLDTPEIAKDEIEQLLHAPRRHGISRSRW